MTRDVPGGQFESPAPNRRVLMRIDHNGEVLIGCIDCNRWGRPGGRDETLGSARTVMTILGALRHEGVEVARGQPMRMPGTQGSRDALNWRKSYQRDLLEDAMPPKLIALGVIAIVLSIMMMIIAPPQDTTHHSADAGDFASSSAQYMPH